MSDQLGLDPAAARQSRRLDAEDHHARQTPPRLPAPGRDVHLTDYVKVIYKRRWTAVIVFVLVAGAVAVSTLTETPIYEARARLLIESDEQNVVSFKQVVEEDQTRADYYLTQYNIIQSRGLARKTLDTLKLWERPPFGGSSPGRQSFSLRRAGSNAAKTVSGWLRPADDAAAVPPPADETRAQSRAIDAFMSGLTIAPIRNSRLVDVKYRSPDPVLATDLVNALSRNYIEQNLEYKFMASKEATDWLGARLSEQRKQVEQAETALQRYREQNDAISLVDRENIVVQKLADLNAAVTKAKTDRIQREATYNQLREAQNNPALLDSFPAILTNGFIQTQKAELSSLNAQYAQLSDKLGDKHPQIVSLQTAIKTAQNKLQAEIAKVVQSVKSEYSAALTQEQSLASALNQQKSEALSMNRKAIEYSVLDRDVQSTRQIYDSLMQRAKETGVAGALKTSNIRIVDAAERPSVPVSPRKFSNLVMGLAGGALFALVVVFFFEYMDNRIKTPDEIRTHLRLPHLGLLPTTDNKHGYPLLNNGVPAVFSEAFRAIRTNVLFSSAVEGSRSVLITSTGPGEGKSMVGANLAIALAQAGQRVLLIDADMRRPKVHEVFKTAQEPGLSNLLVGGVKASEAVRKTPIPGLWILAAGRLPPNPAELLGSPRFSEFMGRLRDHFEWVIVDSPPVMAVTDASLIAHKVTGVLFVVGAEMTSRHVAQRALDQLEHVQAKFVGAVLNKVDLERNAYYYSQYYRREYSRYYASS